MTTGTQRTKGLLLCLAVAVLTAPLMAQNNFDYPGPRYPELPEVKTAADLLDIARIVVQRESRGGSGFHAGYSIKRGQRVLLAVDEYQDRLVVDALMMAMRELGARPDMLVLDYESFFPAMKPADGASELDYFLYPQENVLSSKIFVKRFADAVGQYDVVIHGTGGGDPVSPYRWEKLPYQTLDTFISGAVESPAEVQEAIDKWVWETVLKARKIRVTDAQGTDISWTVRRKDHHGGMNRGHIMGHPGLMDKEVLDAKGVIVGTANHTGVFPEVKIYIDNNKLTDIEGGGSYGENWKALVEKYKDIEWPNHPGTGMSWLYEVAIGTNPKSSRPANVMNQPSRIWSWERTRTGVIHWGIGISRSGAEAEIIKFAKEGNLPYGHLHIHTYFNTCEIETEDGQKIKVIDKGHLAALDDPEVRKIAAKYGDPDEVLKEAWIPAIPGINVEGDYQRDYAPNPAAWITSEHQEVFGEWLDSHRTAH